MVGVLAICAGTAVGAPRGAWGGIVSAAFVARNHIGCQIDVRELSRGIEVKIWALESGVRVGRAVGILNSV